MDESGFVTCTACDITFTTVKQSLGHPCFNEQAPLAKRNSLDGWANVAQILDLRVITMFDTEMVPQEIVIINDMDPSEVTRRYLWVKPFRLFGLDAKTNGDLDPGEALALLARMRKPIKRDNTNG